MSVMTTVRMSRVAAALMIACVLSLLVGCPLGTVPGETDGTVQDGDDGARGQPLPTPVGELDVLVDGEGTVEQVANGVALELTAVPAPDWRFDRWTGTVASTANPLVIAPNENTEVTAHFAAVDQASDSDEDGVGDDDDQCPNTPADATVNDTGCADAPVDSDGDGLPDAVDQCPNTPAGEHVDDVGCVLAPVCGNGIVEVGELCDPPDGTTCDESCQSITPSPPDNNDCGEATHIGEGATPIATGDATKDGPAAGGECDGLGSDVWLCYTPSHSGAATVDFCTSTFDAIATAYDTCNCPPSTAIACDGDSCGQGLGAKLVFDVTGGESYLIRVGGASGAQGTGTLTVSRDPCALSQGGDYDADGICGDVDNCPTTSNADQVDGDGDGAGDACDGCPNDPDNDGDGDGVCGGVDNCPTTSNADQVDGDGDGVGDACDDCSDTDPGQEVDAAGCAIIPDSTPVALFTIAPDPPVLGQNCTVDASTSYDQPPGGEIASHTWDWGDGAAEDLGVNATHAYTQAGTYTITLTVADAEDPANTATASRTITVIEPAPAVWSSSQPVIPGTDLYPPETYELDARGRLITAHISPDALAWASATDGDVNVLTTAIPLGETTNFMRIDNYNGWGRCEGCTTYYTVRIEWFELIVNEDSAVWAFQYDWIVENYRADGQLMDRGDARAIGEQRGAISEDRTRIVWNAAEGFNRSCRGTISCGSPFLLTDIPGFSLGVWTRVSGPVCGNDLVEPDEDCDPPDGVTCDATCQTIDDVGTPVWISTQLLGQYQFGWYVQPEVYEFDENGDLVTAHLNVSRDVIERNGGNLTVLETEIPLGNTSCCALEVFTVNDMDGIPERTMAESIWISQSELVIDGNSASWTFAYRFADSDEHPNQTPNRFSHLLYGVQTGIVSPDERQITWTAVDGMSNECDRYGACSSSALDSRSDHHLGVWRKALR